MKQNTTKKLRETFNSPSRVRGLMRGLALGLVGLAVGLVLVACSSGPSSSAAPSPPAPSPGPGGGETTYEVRFDAKGGTPIPPMQMVTNGVNGNLAVEPKPAPSKDERSELLGWVDENIFKTNAGSTQYFTFANTPISNDLTLVAQWGVKTYLVSFIDGGDLAAETSNQRIKHGSNVIRPAEDPKKTGHTFQNWYADSEFKDTFDFNTKITAATKIYARWTKLSYIVSFDLQGGTTATTITARSVDYGSKIAQPTTTLTRTGYTFTGWYTDRALNNEFTFATDTITENTILYAGWRKNSYVVSFNTGGGSAVNPQTVFHGQKATKPADPTRARFVFDGWYADSEFKIDFNFTSFTITSATNVYAKWLTAYRVSFITNSKIPSAPVFAEQTVGSGKKAIKPDKTPTRTGQFFAGWFTTAATNTLFNFNNPITANTNLYAGWGNSGVIAIFNSGGGSAVAEQRITYGTKATRPAANPTRSGYAFLGWYATAGAITAATPTFNFDTVLKVDTTIYARWIKTYAVTFVTNVGNPNLAVQTVHQGSNAVAPSPAPKRFGYDFGGWYKDAALTTAFSFSTAITTATTLYAKWTLSRHAVTFEMNGATPALPVQNIPHGSGATEPKDPTLTGHTFEGWFVSSDFSGSAFNFSTAITADTTLYAKWERNRYTVTFELNGGSGNAREEVLYTNTVASPAPKRQGHTFEGWFKDSGFTQAFNLSTKITSPITLYAKWKPVTYKVTFEMNGATPSIAQQNIDYSKRATKPGAPSITGFTFGGWFTNAGFSGSAFNFSQGISNTTIFYAKWTRNSYKVTFELNGGSGVAVQNVLYTNKATQPADPTLTGHTFENWYVNSDFSGSAFDFSTTITANRTLYAKWTRNTYTVTFNSGGGSGVAAQNVLYTNKATQPTAPTLTGHTFKGWFTTAATNTGFNFNRDITGPTTIYASWERNTYTVIFNSGGGSRVATQNVLYTNKATRPGNPTREGHTFDKWYVDAGLSTEFDFNAEVTNALTAYAKWNTLGYRVTFITNVGDQPLKAVTVQFTNKVDKPADPSRSGATFAGWFWERGLATAFNFDRDVIKSNTTLYAKWATDTYQVTFDSRAGSAVAAQTIAHNDRVPKPSNPTRSGYAFLNWYTNGGYAGRVFNFDTERITAATTLYARWIKTYSATFVTNVVGNPNFAMQTVREGSNAVKPTSDPTRTGYTFGGWYKDAARTQSFNFGSDVITSATTLYAKWNIKTYKVTFITNVGDPVFATKSVAYTNKATPPSVPTRTGYTFGGWYKDAALTQSFNFGSDVITAPITLYAKWNIKIYDVTYYLADGNSGIGDPGTVFTRQRVRYTNFAVKPVPDPTRAPLNDGRGWRFVRWEDGFGSSEGTAFDFNAPITKNTGVYAYWVNTVRVRFITNNGAKWVDQYVNTGTGRAVRPADPVRTGFALNGWFTDSALTQPFDFATTVGAPITLYAKWTTNAYAVTFQANGGSTVTAQSIAYNQQATSPSNPTRTGYTFGGWFTNSDYTGNQFGFTSERITTAVTLYAKWTLNRYQVTFNTGTGGSAVNPQTINHGQRVTEPSPPTRTGYAFRGWFRAADFTGSVFSFGNDLITAPITLYAKWEVASYRVTFNLGGGTGLGQTNILHGGKVLRPSDPTRSGYAFWNWFKDDKFTQPFNFASETITAATTVYAQWIKTYAVQFATNGKGETQSFWTTEQQTVRQGSNAVKPASDPTRTGYAFDGWYKDAARTQSFNFGSETITTATTVYAKWLTVYRVEFIYPAGVGQRRTNTLALTNTGRVPRPSETPVLENHIFLHWALYSRFNEFKFDTETITGDTSFTIVWRTTTGEGFRTSATDAESSLDSSLGNAELNRMGGIGFDGANLYLMAGKLNNRLFKVEGNGDRSIIASKIYPGDRRFYTKQLALRNGYAYLALVEDRSSGDGDNNRLVKVKLSDKTTEDMLLSGNSQVNATLSAVGGLAVPNDTDLYLLNNKDGWHLAKLPLAKDSSGRHPLTLVSAGGRSYGNKGSGAAFGKPESVVIYNGAAYVVDSQQKALVKVDLSSGNRTIVSKSGTRGTGTAFSTPRGLAFYNGKAYVTDPGTPKALFEVDLSSGNRKVITSTTVGSATTLSEFTPEYVAIYSGVAYVTDTAKHQVLQINLTTGARTVLSR